MNKHEKINHLDIDSNELSCQRLDDSPLDPIELKSSKFDSKYLVSDFDNVESFVNDVVINNELIRSYLGPEDGKWYDPTPLEIEYYRSFPDFIEVVKRLSPKYEYSEQVNAMIACCQAMGLLKEHLDWKKNWSIDPTKNYRDCVGLTGSEIFNMFVGTLREDWKRNNRQAKVNARTKENKARYEEYCRYIDALFKKRARLMVLRLDLFFQKKYRDNIDVFDMTNKLDHLINNAPNNQLFEFWEGYIAKLEYGIDKGFHWHIIIFFDGSMKNGMSHIYWAKKIGEYWVKITKGRGGYWNVNASVDHHEKWGQCGIGVINRKDADKRKNLKHIVGYLFKETQYFRPKEGPKVRLFRKGNFPKKSKRGRPPKASEYNAGDPFIPN